MTARQFVTANWGIMGIGSPAPTNAIISGATYLAPTTTPVLNAALNVGSLVIGGVAAPPAIQQISMRINNNIYENDVVGSYDVHSHGLGRFEVTGAMTVLFETLELDNAILNHEDLSILTTIGAGTGEKYTMSIPKVKGMNGGPVVRGNNQSVIVEMPFQAKFDATSGASMTLTRAVA